MITEKSNAIHAVQQELLQDLSQLANDVLYKSEHLADNNLALEVNKLANIALFSPHLLAHLLLQELGAMLGSGHASLEDGLIYESLDLAQRLLLEDNEPLFDEWFITTNKIYQRTHESVYSFDSLDQDIHALSESMTGAQASKFKSIQTAIQLFIVASLRGNSSKVTIAEKIKLALSEVDSKSVLFIQLKDLLQGVFDKEQTRNDLMFLGRFERALNKHLLTQDLQPLKKMALLVIESKNPSSLLNAKSNENFLSYFGRLKLNCLATTLSSEDKSSEDNQNQDELIQLLDNNRVLLNVFSVYKGASAISEKRFDYIKEKLFVKTEKNKDKKNRLLALIEGKQKLAYEMKVDLQQIRERAEQGQMNVSELSRLFERFAHIATIADFSAIGETSTELSEWVKNTENLDSAMPEIIVDFEGALEKLQGNGSVHESPDILEITNIWLGKASSLLTQIQHEAVTENDSVLEFSDGQEIPENGLEIEKADVSDSVQKNTIEQLKESINSKLEQSEKKTESIEIESKPDNTKPNSSKSGHVVADNDSDGFDDMDFELDWEDHSEQSSRNQSSLEIVQNDPVVPDEQKDQNQEDDGPKKSHEGGEDAQIIPFSSASLNNKAPEKNENPLNFSDQLTEEMRAIFNEEANEIIEQLQELLVHWQDNIEDEDDVSAIRKHFHTLKGSSKMVGLTDVGQLSWSTENMLNIFMAHNAPYHPAIPDAINQSLLWIKQFEDGAETDDSVYKIIASLDELSSYLTQGGSEEERLEYLNSRVGIDSSEQIVEPVEPEQNKLSDNDLLEVKCLYGTAWFYKKHPEKFEDELFDNYKTQLFSGIKSIDSSFAEQTLSSESDLLANIKKVRNTLGDFLEQKGKAPDYDDAIGAMLLSQEYFAIKELSFEDFTELSIFDALDEFKRVEFITQDIARFEEVHELCQLVVSQLTEEAEDLPFDDYMLCRSAMLFLKQLDCYASGLVIPSAKSIHDLIDRGQQDSDEMDLNEAVLEKDDFDFFEKEIRSVYDILDTENKDVEDNPDIEIQRIFLDEADELLERYALQLASWDEVESNQGFSNVQRILHTLKGSAYSASFPDLGEKVHLHEDLLDQLQRNKADSSEQLKQLEVIYHDLLEQVTTAQAGLNAVNQPEATPKFETIEKPISEQPEEKELNTDSLMQLAQKTKKKMVEVQGSHSNLRLSADFIQEISELSSENNVNRAQLEANLKAVDRIFNDVTSTLGKLNQNVKELEIEAVQQTIETKKSSLKNPEFDSLEMDRYPKVYELSQRLSEMTLDLMDYRGEIEEKLQEMDLHLSHQNKISRDMSNEIQVAQMVTLNSLMPRIKKIVADISSTLDKEVDVSFSGMEARIGRKSIQKLMYSLEHLIRNAIYHGIEDKEARKAAEKPVVGKIEINAIETPEALTFQISDDGRGIDVEAVHKKAIAKGLVNPDVKLSESEIIQLVFASGLSTSSTVNEVSGRGIGLDSVLNELQKVGAQINIDSKLNQGATFAITLPYSVNSNSVLMVKVNDVNFGIPLMYVKGISRLDGTDQLDSIDYGGNNHKIYDAGALLFNEVIEFDKDQQQRIIVLNEMVSLEALRVTEFFGVQEVALTPMADIASVSGLYPSSTVAPDGSVVLMLNPHALIQRYAKKANYVAALEAETEQQPLLPVNDELIIEPPEVVEEDVLEAESAKAKSNDEIRCLIVDDSITVRKITQRLLQRHSFVTETAKDGLDALGQLEDYKPNVVLLDLEMPRMDGYDFMKVLKSKHDDMPISVIMITSRVGEKHRKRAEELGVNEYLGKPYDDETLISTIKSLVNEINKETESN